MHTVALRLQDDQVPASRIQLHTQNLDLSCWIHSVPELRQGATQETQAEDLYCKTRQRSYGSRVGQRLGRISPRNRESRHERESDLHRFENKESEWVDQEISSFPEGLCMWLSDSCTINRGQVRDSINTIFLSKAEQTVFSNAYFILAGLSVRISQVVMS